MGTRTFLNLGPLTTVFTPPPDCTTHAKLALVNQNPQQFGLLDGIWCTSTPTVVSSSSTSTYYQYYITSCFPSGHASYINSAPGSEIYSLAGYSPGLSCPAGQTGACTITKQAGDPEPTGSADIYRFNLLSDGQQAVQCCSSGFQCHPDFVTFCVAAATSGQVVSAQSWMDPTCSPTPTIITFTADGDVSQNKGPLLASGGAIILLAPATAGSSASPALPSQTGGADQNNPEPNGSSGLSMAAQIAIGVVVAVLAVCAIVAILFFLRRRRKKKNSPATRSELEGSPATWPGRDTADDEKTEVNSTNPRSPAEQDPANKLEVHEIDSTALYELPAETSVRRSGSNLRVSSIAAAKVPDVTSPSRYRATNTTDRDDTLPERPNLPRTTSAPEVPPKPTSPMASPLPLGSATMSNITLNESTGRGSRDIETLREERARLDAEIARLARETASNNNHEALNEGIEGSERGD